MSLLKKLFGLDAPEPDVATPDDTAAIRKITAALDRMDRDQARYIAAFAYVLGRVALADQTISEEESRTMERIVMERGGLAEDVAILVVQIAKTQNLLFGSTEDYLVTRKFNDMAAREQKLALLDCLFAVSAADQDVSGAEDSEIRQITQELKLDHSDFIDARTRYVQYLSVMKKESGAP